MNIENSLCQRGISSKIPEGNTKVLATNAAMMP